MHKHINSHVSMMKSLTGVELQSWTGKITVARKVTLRVWKTGLSKLNDDLKVIRCVQNKNNSYTLLGVIWKKELLVGSIKSQFRKVITASCIYAIW